ncbi:ESPR-type extended signal peptide-containing protein [Acidaminococcus fermentans]|uniref:ESPR-type extended signal peptide-containing protein n=1 Tax=Acidaminococcus fermentans TaxID=905 RepID=UPI002E77329D|nr:ESPR-type extended signal peptide-containing protein [Acidaminococcus fermentans]MEE1597672.1 ESPR-type extended signal peptide-containing protein [Acidaminococcus fermentans]MEE4121934.1 ESPR-type extended signal peptide-containing protein [Acidaminococcus fermentans]
MNRIYKVIWSKVRNSWVVVSEIARNHGKEHSQRKNIPGGVYALTLALALGLTWPSGAWAADKTVDLGNGGAAAYDNKGNLTVGKVVQGQSTDNKGENNTAIGTQSDTLRNVTEGDTTKNGQPMDAANTKLVDGEGAAHKLDTSTESGGSTAVGYNNKAEGDNSTAIGNTAKITNKPITYYADKDGNKTTSTDNAAWYKDSSGNPTQVPQVFRDADGNTTTVPQYVHTYTVKDPDTGAETTKTEITSDVSKADRKDGKPVYSYLQSDNLEKLYSVTLYQAASNSIAAGTSVTANGSNAVAVGYNSTADNSAVAIGDTAAAKENAVAIGKNTKADTEGSIALGKGSQADRSGGTTGWDPKTGTTSTQSGLAWKSTEGALSVGSGSVSRQITGVAAGSEDTDAVNLAQLKNAMTHYYSVKTTESTDAAGNNNYLNDGATGDNALAAGVSAVAKGNNATAVGTQTYASGENASAYGYRSVASGTNSLAIGSGTSAQQEGSVAVGGHAQGYYAVQVGTNSTAQSAYSVAVGGHAKGDHSVEVGYGSTAQGSYSTSVGGHAIGDDSIAIGSESKTIGGTVYRTSASAAGSNSIAIGGHTNSDNNIAIGSGSATSGQYAITVGGHATSNQAVSIGGVATNSQAIAVGYGSSSTGSQSTAVGGHAGDTNSTAVGQGANANYAYATAVGNSSVASGDHSTALGYGTSSQGSYSTAIGGASAKGTNLTVIGKDSSASASSWDDPISNSTAIGGAHISASNATAVGSSATVNGQYGVALGYNSNVSNASTGVGTETKASNTGTAVGYGAQAHGNQSASVGAGSKATGQNAVALGGGGAWGDYSIALGSGAGTTAHGIAIGQNSGAWGESAIAIGEGTNAWRANSIVLGKNSKSGADKNIEGYDPRTGVASGDDTSTWQSTDEAVSIGRAEERDGDGNITATAITRQLNNLAAGTLDTDAVNVAQLKAATQKVNVHDYSVWSPDTETDTNYTNEGAVAKNSLAAGVSAKATGDSAVAIGNGAQAEGKGATVIGKNAKATGQYATAFGGLETTDKKGNIVNIINTASGASSTAFGQGAQAKGAASLAFGHNTVAGADDGSGQQSVAFGEDTQALGGRSLAFGEKTIAKYNDSVAFGNDTRASSTGATAFGNRTRALAQYSTAWGNATVAADEESTAWGTDTIAGAKLDENGAVTNKYTEDDTNKTEQMDVHGNLAYTYTSAADNKVHTAGIKQMPIDSGSELHDYVVLAGKDGNTYVRDYQGSLWKVNVDANGNVTIDTSAGTNGKVYNGQKKTSSAKTTINGTEVAITPDNVLTKAHEGTNGYNIDGYKDATAFGYSTEASGDYATAFGNDTKAAAAGATAFGYKTLASGENSTAFGENSIAAGKNSLAALGATTTDAATNAAAIGSGAKATLADSVALGSGALANRASGSKGYDVLTGTASTNTSAAWVSNANALAIGNDTEGSLLTRQITGVAAGSLDTDAVNVAQLKGAGLSFTTNTKDASNTTDNYKGYKVVSRKLGDTISIKASDEAANHSYSTANLTTRIAENGDISILMDENPAFTSVTTSDVIFAGNPDLTDKDGKAAKADTNAAYGTKTLTDSQNITSAGNDTQATRLHYKDDQGHTYEVATMDDGQIYAGDIKTDGTLDNTGFARTMNQKTTINGGVTEKDKLTDNNIGVVSNGTDTLTVKLAKDLKDLNSVTTGKTVQNDSGIKITNNAGDETKNVIINGDQISFGGNQVNNMGSGSDGTADGKPTYNTDTNGANIGDVKNIAGSTTDAAKLTGDSNITVTYNDAAAGGKNTVKLNDSITLGSDDGKKVTIDGTKGTITAGDKVSFDGSTGIGSIGGVTIGSQTGVATTKKDGDKAKTEDGTFVTGLTNTTWNPDANGIVSGRAATEDQLKTVSDTVNAGWELDVNDGKQKDVTPTSRKVNFKQGQNIIISGSGDDVTVRTDDTVRFTTINVTGDKDASGSYTGGITIGKQSGGNSANPGPGYYITGLENTSWNSSQIQSGRAATEDQLKQVAEDIKHGTVDGDKYITGGNATYDESGKGSAALTGTNGLEGTISNLHDYYVTRGEVSNDGKTLIMTKNDGTTFNVSLDKVMQSDMRLVKNPASKDGKYTVDNNGDLTLTVQDANGTEATKQTITLSGLASKEEVDKGLNFAANSGTAYNAKLGGKVTIKGSDLKTGHDYSEDNLTTEVDADGNITIKMDKDLTANTVTVSGKDGKDGQIGITGKDGADGTVTTIIKTIGKNGTDGKNGTPGVNGTDGITRIVYQDGEAGTTTHTVSTLDDGLKFGANMPVAGKTANPVGNKLNSTINIKGAGTKELDKYSGQNLLTSVEQDVDGNTTIHVLMDKNISADSVVVGQEGKAGKDGKDGYIGINGKDGADGITTTIIRTEKGQPGADGKNGKPGVDGTDITRIVYTDKNGQNPQTVATLDDGLKFAGDDGQNDDTKVINKKLNERLDIVGKAQGDLTDANIGVTKDDNGKLYIRLAKHVNLDDGTLQAGDATIGHFTNTELTTNKGNHPVDGSYTIGLSNKDWSVTAPDYVSGRAATEDQLAKVSEAITNATTAAGKRTVVTVNDKSDPATADPGTNTYGEYDKKNGNLMIAAERDSDGLMTYNIKLNDNLALGKDGADGQEGTIGMTGKDGLPGADGKQGYSTTIIKTEKGQAGKDGKTGKENLGGTDITRIVYTDKDGQNAQTVATLDDGLKFVGNDGQEVIRKLNTTLSIKGGITDATDLKNASSKNLGVRQNADKDGLEIVMTDTPDFEKVTVGKDAAKKITIGGQTVTGKKSDGTDGTAETGNYITGLDNTKWNKDNVVANRAATEGQLRDIAGSITNQQQGGGFALSSDEKGADKIVKQDLGKAIQIKGDTTYKADGKVEKAGNIKTSIDNGAIKVELNKDVDLGNDGSIKAGNTTVNSNGVETNKVKVGDITITDQGINGGAKKITNIASGIDGKQYAEASDNNAASIGDVKQLAKNEAKASEAKSGKNITVKDDHTVNLNDDITLGDAPNKQVAIHGSNGQVTIGSGDSALTLGQQGNDVADGNPEKGNYLNGLDNREWDGEHIQNGRAATEDQLKTVSDKVNSGRKFQGDDGQEVKVGLGETLNLKGGAKEISSADNIGIVKGDDNTLNVRLAKELTGLNSVTTGSTTINNSGLTVKTGDANRTITVQDGKVDMGGNQIHNVAPGTAPTDAVNVSQLQQTGRAINQLGNSVNKLGARVDRVGANSAALAALHPLDFDPDDKLDFAVGAGSYSGANAVALGAFYRPNEDVMFSLGGSTGGGENMVNIGATFKLGQHNHVSNSRVAMAKEIRGLKELVAKQEGEMQQLKTLMNQMAGRTVMKVDKDALFPDIPENHWAYDYVTKLARAGIVEGYEDGEFKGNRMMTRYEFAAVIYRAIMAGAGSNPALDQDGTLGKLVKEFDGELKYIRIDVIEKDKHGNPTIERVRTVEDSEKHHGK